METLEQAIQAKGLTAPRITPQEVQDNIVGEYFFTAQDGVTMHAEQATVPNDHDVSLGLLTFCVIVLANGFTVTGESACASPENFDAEIGRRIARENAVQKIRPLMGYELKSALHNEKNSAA